MITTFQDFEKILNTMIAEEKEIGATKAQEYANSDDRLANFRRLAKELDLTPEKVLWVYLKKHLDSIAYYIKAGCVKSDEPIESRIKDARVYLSLLRAMVEERYSEQRVKV